MRRRGRQDTVLVRSLLVFGLTLVVGAYLAAPHFAQRVLHTGAVQTADRWASHGARLLGDPNVTRAFALRHDARVDGLVEFSVIGADGLTQIHERIGHGSDLRGTLADIVVPEADVRVALEGRRIERFAVGDGRHLAELVLPARQDGRIVGVVRLVIDQTATAQTLNSSLGVLSATMVFFVWVGFFIPTVLAWRRMAVRGSGVTPPGDERRHDALTGVASGLVFRDRMDRALARARRSAGAVAVFALDVDQLADVNEALGTAVGDDILKAIARRLEENVRDVDTVARLGQDSFAVIAEDIKSTENLIAVTMRLVEALAQPHDVEGVSVDATVSIGVAVSPADGLDSDTLLHQADMALDRAKAEGRGALCFADAVLDAEVKERRDIERDLREAVRENAFVVDYGPEVHPVTRELTGYAARLQVMRKDHGRLPADRVAAIAEDTGLVVAMTDWLLAHACRDAAGWIGNVTVSVRLSPVFTRHRDVASAVERALQETGLDPRRLILEVTEQAFARHGDAVTSQLLRLRGLGVSVVLVDVGATPQSLAMLTRFPFDRVIVSDDLVRSIAKDAHGAEILRGLTEFGPAVSAAVGEVARERIDALAQRLRAETGGTADPAIVPAARQVA